MGNWIGRPWHLWASAHPPPHAATHLGILHASGGPSLGYSGGYPSLHHFPKPSSTYFRFKSKLNLFRVLSDCPLSLHITRIWEIKNLPRIWSPIFCFCCPERGTPGDADRHYSRGPRISADSDRVPDTTGTKHEDGHGGFLTATGGL